MFVLFTAPFSNFNLFMKLFGYAKPAARETIVNEIYVDGGIRNVDEGAKKGPSGAYFLVCSSRGLFPKFWKRSVVWRFLKS